MNETCLNNYQVFYLQILASLQHNNKTFVRIAIYLQGIK